MAEDESTTLRHCIGSVRYGIAAHDAPVSDFPRQPSQKDGLGRMCKVHWNKYTGALRNAALARKAAEVAEVVPTEPAPVEAPKGSSGRKAEPVAEAVAERAVG